MDCYEEILYSTRQPKLSFAAQEIKDTIADIGNLLNQIYEQPLQEEENLESIIQNEPLRVLEEESSSNELLRESFESPAHSKGILKNKNQIIETLESATERIIEGLEDLKLVAQQGVVSAAPRKPLKTIVQNSPAVVSRLYQHQKIKEDKLKALRAEKERQESYQGKVKVNKKKILVGTVPLFKRVDKIMEEKQKWLAEQQNRKQQQEEAYYNSFTFRPTTQCTSTGECIDTFIECQRQWLQRKNESLLNQKLQKENVELTFKPSLCAKSTEILNRSSMSQRQFSSNQRSDQQYPSVRSD